MDAENKKELIRDTFLATHKLYDFIKLRSRNPRKYGTEDFLFMAEVDMLDVIGSKDDIHAVDIAQMFNISKSAVSKTTEKLCRKGLIKRIPNPNDSRKMILTLTPKGQIVYDYHKNIDNTADSYVECNLSDYTEEELKAFLKVANVFIKAAYDIIGLNDGID